MLFLEGAINENSWGGTTFTRIKAPCHNDMVELVHTISQRIARYLEKVGLVQRDMENSYLNLPVDDEDSLLQLQALLGGRHLLATALLWGHNKGRRCLPCRLCRQVPRVNMDS